MRSELVFRWGVLILLALIWGSSFILMKIGLVAIPFNELGALRMLLAFFALMPIGIRYWFKIDRKYWKYLLIVGLCGNGIPAFLFAFAQTRINSSLAGMLNSMVPLFTLLFGLLFFDVKSKFVHWTGVVTGLVGAIFLLYRPGIAIDSSSMYGLYVVAATVCYATSVNVIKKYLFELSSTVITSASLIFVGPICGLYLFSTDFPDRISTDHAFVVSFLAVLVLSVFATGLAILIFNMLIKRVSALYASSVTYLIPVIAILWGVSDGEVVSLTQLAGMGGILTGIYLINR
ncbi:MAG TPA: EamA family transporter [Flavobacteriales bacterium]|nr:EamA family transporter [Flavobacteriales bacterium]